MTEATKRTEVEVMEWLRAEVDKLNSESDGIAWAVRRNAAWRTTTVVARKGPMIVALEVQDVDLHDDRGLRARMRSTVSFAARALHDPDLLHEILADRVSVEP